MKGYTTREVAELLDLPVDHIRRYARAGFVQPERGAGNEYSFSFQDLVLLRAAADLTRENVPLRRVTAALARLKARLPTGQPLSGVQFRAEGDDVLVSEAGEPPWDPASGQVYFDFAAPTAVDDADRTAAARDAGVLPMRPRAPHESAADAKDRGAEDWFVHALELESSDPAGARAAYERALAQRPGLTDARVNLGRLLHLDGLLAEAEAAYRQVLEDREHPLAAYNLGVLLEDQARLPEALQAYARAIAVDPALAEAHYNLARLYEQRGDRRSAIRHFNGYRELLKRT